MAAVLGKARKGYLAFKMKNFSNENYSLIPSALMFYGEYTHVGDNEKIVGDMHII